MVFKYKGNKYPEVIKHGNAVKYIAPIALEFCKGNGVDVGGTNDWCLPGAKPVNTLFDNEYNANNLPPWRYDYIFSSHCLEHLDDPIKTLKYWYKMLSTVKNDIINKRNGVLVLYLPHPDMEYWLPQNNTKHLHSWQPAEMAKILTDLGYKDVIHSERDMYYSFCVVGRV